MAVPTGNEVDDTTAPVSASRSAPPKQKGTNTITATTTKNVTVHGVHRVDENKNVNGKSKGCPGGREKDEDRSDLAHNEQQQPHRYSIIRYSDTNPDQNRMNRYRNHPSSPESLWLTTARLTPREEERFRSCVVLISSWAFLLISIMFLVCYLYQLEWSPETADPIQIFALDLAVNMLYLMFTIDIFASIGIIVSYKEHVKPFRLRVYWPAVVILILNHIHGTLIWLWVWTGEFPRTCARNSYYFGRRCENLAFILLTNPAGPLRPSDCKCDYGTCLPECKGLRLIQNYFWGTYWLYLIRWAVLIILIPWLNQSICQCKCCCCIDPRDLPTVSPEQGTEIAIAITADDDERYNNATTERTRMADDSRSKRDSCRCNDETQNHCCHPHHHDCSQHERRSSHHHCKKVPPPCYNDNYSSSCPFTNQRDAAVVMDQPGKPGPPPPCQKTKGTTTMACFSRQNPHDNDRHGHPSCDSRSDPVHLHQENEKQSESNAKPPPPCRSGTMQTTSNTILPRSEAARTTSNATLPHRTKCNKKLQVGGDRTSIIQSESCKIL